MKQNLLQTVVSSAIWATAMTLLWAGVLVSFAVLVGGFDWGVSGMLRYLPGIPLSILGLTVLMTIWNLLAELQLRHSKRARKALRDYLDKDYRGIRKRG